MRPVTTKPIPGTPWQEVRTDTGHVYWFNSSSGESVWDIPEDVRSRAIDEKIRASRGDAGDSGGQSHARAGAKRVASKALVSVDAKTMAAMRRAKANGAVLAPGYEALFAEEMIAQGKKKRDKNDQKHKDGKKRKKKRQKGGEEEKAAAVGAGKEDVDVEFDVEFDEDEILGDEAGDAGTSVEDIEDAYIALLREHGVHQFSRYETVEKKVCGDARFSAVVDEKRRRMLFEAYCAGKGIVGGGAVAGKSEKRARRAAGGGHDAAYKALLQDKVKDHGVRWNEISRVLENDPRYGEATASLDDSQRRRLFEDHCRMLRNAADRRAAGDEMYARDIEAGRRRKLENARQDAMANFSALLAEVVRVPGSYEEALDVLRADPQRRMLEDDATAREMHARHVANLRDTALEKIIKLFGLRAMDKRQTCEQVSVQVEEDPDFFGFSAELVEAAWRAFCDKPGMAEVAASEAGATDAVVAKDAHEEKVSSRK